MSIIRLEDIRPDEIALDNDGVIYPLRKPYISFINATTGSGHNPDEEVDYQFSIFGMSPHQFHRSFIDFHRHKISMELPPYSSSIHILDLLNSLGIHPPIISSRDSSLEDVTLQSFARDFEDKIRSKDIHIGIYDKVAKMRELGKKLLIEDSYGNAKAVRDAGFPAMLLDHSYNKNGRGGIPEEDHPGIYRIYGGLLGIIDKLPMLKQAIRDYSSAPIK